MSTSADAANDSRDALASEVCQLTCPTAPSKPPYKLRCSRGAHDEQPLDGQERLTYKTTAQMVFYTLRGQGSRTSCNSRETGGFVWWGTQAALDSWVINEVEIPAALERASTEPLYPLVPVFVDLNPSKNRKEILGALGDHAEDILGRNGVIRKASEPADAFRRRIAGRYIRNAVPA
jgi:hypothetical protein